MLPKAVQAWLQEQGYGDVVASRAVGGGCINHGQVIQTHRGQSLFLKTNRQAPQDMFECEAAGLQALHRPGAPQVPESLLFGPDFLLMTDLAPAAPARDYWPVFGHQLAALHRYTCEQFGFEHDNYIGSTPQPNPWQADGHRFFAEQRLLYQARLARRRNLIEAADLAQVEGLAARLPDLVPEQPASLLHGDLWTGNAASDSAGRPALIDPAAHYGWAEAELAMTTLFGSFPAEFYAAYEEARPLAPGYRSRFDLYNLYHLLNHVNLFGRGYLGQVQSILRRYR